MEDIIPSVFAQLHDLSGLHTHLAASMMASSLGPSRFHAKSLGMLLKFSLPEAYGPGSGTAWPVPGCRELVGTIRSAKILAPLIANMKPSLASLLFQSDVQQDVLLASFSAAVALMASSRRPSTLDLVGAMWYLEADRCDGGRSCLLS